MKRAHLLLLLLTGTLLGITGTAAGEEKFPCYNCRAPACPTLDAPPCEVPKARRKAPPRVVEPPAQAPVQAPPQQEVRVERSISSPPAQLHRSFWSRHRFSLGLGGAALALAAAGLGVGISTWQGYDDLRQSCAGGTLGCLPDLAPVQDRALATNTLFGLAGGVAVVAIGVFLFGERTPRAPSELR